MLEQSDTKDPLGGGLRDTPSIRLPLALSMVTVFNKGSVAQISHLLFPPGPPNLDPQTKRQELTRADFCVEPE